MTHVHNTTLDKVPNAIPGRDSTTLDIAGMNGIPHDDEAWIRRNGIQPQTVPQPVEYATQQMSQQMAQYQFMYQQQMQAMASYLQCPTHTPPPPGMPHPSTLSAQYVMPNFQPVQVPPVQETQEITTIPETGNIPIQPSENTIAMSSLPGLVFKHEFVSPEELRAQVPRFQSS